MALTTARYSTIFFNDGLNCMSKNLPVVYLFAGKKLITFRWYPMDAYILQYDTANLAVNMCTGMPGPDVYYGDNEESFWHHFIELYLMYVAFISLSLYTYISNLVISRCFFASWSKRLLK